MWSPRRRCSRREEASRWNRIVGGGLIAAAGADLPEIVCRATVGQIAEGSVMELAVKYRGVDEIVPRDNH